MNALDLDNRIVRMMTHLVTEVKAFSAMDRTDINRVAQNVLVPLLSEVYDYRQLRNLDIGRDANFPGIDLADDDAQVAIQVTSTSSIDKIKHTIQQFLKKRPEFATPLRRKYKRLIVYILTEKQKTYSQESFDRILDGRFSFDAKGDIWDFKNVLGEVQGLPIEKKQRILSILEEQVGHTLALLSEKNLEQVPAGEGASQRTRTLATLLSVVAVFWLATTIFFALGWYELKASFVASTLVVPLAAAIPSALIYTLAGVFPALAYRAFRDPSAGAFGCSILFTGITVICMSFSDLGVKLVLFLLPQDWIGLTRPPKVMALTYLGLAAVIDLVYFALLDIWARER